MIRTQILLDPATYGALRRAAAEQGKGISALAREMLGSMLGPRRKPGKKGRLYDWKFIGCGRDREGKTDVAVRHDHYLNDGKRW